MGHLPPVTALETIFVRAWRDSVPFAWCLKKRMGDGGDEGKKAHSTRSRSEIVHFACTLRAMSCRNWPPGNQSISRPSSHYSTLTFWGKRWSGTDVKLVPDFCANPIHFNRSGLEGSPLSVGIPGLVSCSWVFPTWWKPLNKNAVPSHTFFCLFRTKHSAVGA